jgi:uncharacterized phiE125 gp8 family phage protein
MRLAQYIAPTAEPVHITEAKLHLRLAVDAAGAVLYTTEDALLSGIVAAARQVAETETWKSLVLTVWDLFLDEWPAENEIRLHYPPLRSVEFVKYTTSDGTETTFTDFTIDPASTPGRIVLDYDQSWPSDTLAPNNPIHIRFRAGYLVPFTATASTDVLAAVNHPFVDGDKVRLSVSGGDLPAGLAAKTDYFVRDAVAGVSLKLAATSGGVAIDLTTAGTGNMFIGEIPPVTVAGMKLVMTDLYENRGDTVIGVNTTPATLPRAATHLFAMDSARSF